MDEKAENRNEELKDKSKEELITLFMRAAIDQRCLEIFTQIFRDYCVFCGTYLDSRFVDGAYKSFDEFQDIATPIKRQLLDTYVKLELTGEQLKN